MFYGELIVHERNRTSLTKRSLTNTIITGSTVKSGIENVLHVLRFSKVMLRERERDSFRVRIEHYNVDKTFPKLVKKLSVQS